MQSATTGGLINKEELLKDIIRPTRRRKRFINYLVDVVFFYMIMFAFGIVWGGMALLTGTTIDDSDSSSLMWNLISIVCFLAYFITFEIFLGKTIGKMVTNTKVVLLNGSKPSPRQIIIRSFARMIPFDPFSFLSPNPRGWHDTISETIVIDDISLYSVGSREITQAKPEEDL
jgi:uncharacterized RDD family membrane protein YckC